MHSAGDALLDLPFDQYQRYRSIADVCDAVRAPGRRLDVLDVGGRTAVLRRFLPEDEVVLVDVEPSGENGLVLGSGDRLPFRDASFDVAVASDTLEHVPPGQREAFTRECCRVARRHAVLAGPYRHPRVDEAEELLQAFLTERVGERHRYLEEHRALGLPELDDVLAWCRAAGAREVRAIGHGELERWLGLMTLALYLDADAPLRPAARRIHRFYNTLLYPGDRGGQPYRHVVVAAFGDAPLPAEETLFAPREPSTEARAAIAHALAEVATFDRERDVVLPERRRLEGEIERAREDVAGHRARLADLEVDLAEHVQSLAETRAELAAHRSALATAEADLAGHRSALAGAEADLAGHRSALAAAEADLAGHRSALAATEADLAGHRESLAAARAELEGLEAEHRDVVDRLRGENGALRSHAEALLVELEDVRREAREIQAELLRKTRWRRTLWRLLGREQG